MHTWGCRVHEDAFELEPLYLAYLLKRKGGVTGIPPLGDLPPALKLHPQLRPLNRRQPPGALNLAMIGDSDAGLDSGGATDASSPGSAGVHVDLDVDYEGEIEPNLGRLIGRGAFGVVYEAMWRGQKVSFV